MPGIRGLSTASAAAALLLLSAACAPPEPRASDPTAEGTLSPVASRGPRALAVETARVRRGELHATLVATGSIISRRSTPIAPAVSGRISRIHVRFGDEVEADAELFEIDRRNYEIAERAARAQLALAQAEASQARLEVRRSEQLAEKEVVSEQRHEQLRTAAQVARARVEQARAQLLSASNDLSRTVVHAPYAGFVVGRLAHEGAMATSSTTVVVLQERGALEAELKIPEATPIAVRAGDLVRVWVQGRPEPISSRVETVARQIDPATRTYDVRVPLDSVDERVKAGAFVRGEIEPTYGEAVALVPLSALGETEGHSHVFRVTEGLAERVPVELGALGERYAEIRGGLSEGDLVVVGSVVERLADGLPIVAEPAPEEAASDLRAPEIRPSS